MASLKITRITINHTNGVKREKVIMQAEHKTHSALHRIYNLLLASKALEGGDRILYKKGRKVTTEYRLCMICCKRAIEGGTVLHCSVCSKNKKQEQDAAIIASVKPKPDYSKFYKY